MNVNWMILPYSLNSNALVTSTAIWITSAALGVPISPMLRVSYGRSWLIPNHSSFLLFANLLAAPSAVDYVLGNLALTPSLTSCVISEDHPRTMSQFSPVSIWMSLNYLSRHITLFLTSAGNTLWMMALLCYIHLIVTWWGHSWILGHRATRQYDISYVCKSLINIFLSTIPSMKACNRNHTWVFAPFLSLLCWRSHVAYWEWKACWPRSGVQK